MCVKPGPQCTNHIDIPTCTVCCLKLELGSILPLQMWLLKKHSLQFLLKKFWANCTQQQYLFVVVFHLFVVVFHLFVVVFHLFVVVFHLFVVVFRICSVSTVG